MAYVRAIDVQWGKPYLPVLVAPDHIATVSQGGVPVEKTLKGDLGFDGAAAVVLEAEDERIYDRNANPKFRGIKLMNLSFGDTNASPLVFYIENIPAKFEGKDVALRLRYANRLEVNDFFETWSAKVTNGAAKFVLKPARNPPFGIRGKMRVMLGVSENLVETVEDIDLEVYMIDTSILPNLFSTGIPLLLLRMFLAPMHLLNVNGYFADDEHYTSWVTLVTSIVHGSRKPFTGQISNTTEHWLKYETGAGSASFAGMYGESGLRVTAWLDAWRNWNQHGLITTVNCYDQAAATEVALTLGLPYEQIAWEYHQVFGFIKKEAQLVGWGPCNNPYFNCETKDMILDSKDPRRQPFRNHALLSWSRTPITAEFIASWNLVMAEMAFADEYEAAAAQLDADEKLDLKMIDACAGPHLGSESRKQYESTKELLELPYPKHWAEEVKRSYKDDPKNWREKHSLGRGIVSDNTGSVQHLLPKYVADRLAKEIANLDKLLPTSPDQSDFQTGSFQSLTDAFATAVQKAHPNWQLSPIPIRPYNIEDGAVKEVKFTYTRETLVKGEAFCSMRVAVSRSAVLAKKELINHLAFRSLTSNDKLMMMFEERPEARVIGSGTIRSILIRNVSVDIVGPELWDSDKDYKIASDILLWLALSKPTRDPAKWKGLLE